MSNDNALIFNSKEDNELITEIDQNNAIFESIYSAFIESIRAEMLDNNENSQFLNDVQLEGIRFMCRLASGCETLVGADMVQHTSTYFPSNMAINGDQMGTGKTIQLIVACLFLKEFFKKKSSLLPQEQQQLDIRILILAPKFLVRKWMVEFEKFFSLRGESRLIETDEDLTSAMSTSSVYANLFVMSSSILEGEGFADFFIGTSFEHQISWIVGIDEVHYHRAEKPTNATKAIMAIRLAELIWATMGCSGTCVMNHPLEIYNIMSVLSGVSKNVLGHSTKVKKECSSLESKTQSQTIETDPTKSLKLLSDCENISSSLQQRVNPVMICRLGRESQNILEMKVFTIFVKMTKFTKTLYEATIHDSPRTQRPPYEVSETFALKNSLRNILFVNDPPAGKNERNPEQGERRGKRKSRPSDEDNLPMHTLGDRWNEDFSLSPPNSLREYSGIVEVSSMTAPSATTSIAMENVLQGVDVEDDNSSSRLLFPTDEDPEEEINNDSNRIPNTSLVQIITEIVKIIIRTTNDKIVIYPDRKNLADHLYHHFTTIPILNGGSDEVPDYIILKMDGLTNDETRMSYVSMINDSTNPKRLLITTEEISREGLDIQGANHQILPAVSEVPQAHMQNLARCYRQGQLKQVFAYVIISKETYIESEYMKGYNKMHYPSVLAGHPNTYGICHNHLLSQFEETQLPPPFSIDMPNRDSTNSNDNTSPVSRSTAVHSSRSIESNTTTESTMSFDGTELTPDITLISSHCPTEVYESSSLPTCYETSNTTDETDVLLGSGILSLTSDSSTMTFLDGDSSTSELGTWYKPLHESSTGDFINKKDGSLDAPFTDSLVLVTLFQSQFARDEDSTLHSVSTKFYDTFPHLD